MRPDLSSFVDWLRKKRAAYRLLLAACAAGALAFTLAMYWFHFETAAVGGWNAAPAFARLPWWLFAWGIPFAYVAGVAVAVLLVEATIHWLRLDPGDLAWSSMGWTLRGWLPALVLTPVLAVCAFASAVVPVLASILPVLLMFLVWHHAFLSAPKPAFPWRPRWPGMLPVVLAFAAIVFIWWPTGDEDDWPNTWPVYVEVAAFLLVAAYLRLAFQLLWLDARRGWRAASRDAIRPRVFLPMIVLYLRWALLVPMLVAPFVPLAWFLIEVAPWMEEPLFRADVLIRSDIVSMSRFAVAWWWAISLVLTGAVFASFGWISPVSAARLLYEMGRVPRPVGQAG